MHGAVKHIVLLIVGLVVILLLLIPAVRRMEPHHDIAPPPVHDTTTAASPPTQEKRDEGRVRDAREKPPKPAETPPPPTAGEWHEITTWDGIGPQTTEPFTVRGDTWRIHWQTEVLPSLGAGAFQIMVFDSKGGLKTVAATATKTDQRTTNLSGAGVYTLQINTLQKWKVRIEEKR